MESRKERGIFHIRWERGGKVGGDGVRVRFNLMHGITGGRGKRFFAVLVDGIGRRARFAGYRQRRSRVRLR